VKHLFWLIPNQLAGRPGPNSEPWNLSEIRHANIRAILSVNDGELCNPEEFLKADIRYACTPLSRNAPPLPGDLEICIEALPTAFSFAHNEIQNGHNVLVHCTAGKDRTGLFLAYYLMRTNHITPVQAINKVRTVRPVAFTAEGYEKFALEVLLALRD
jgi:protein-tyrosine phosphatase